MPFFIHLHFKKLKTMTSEVVIDVQQKDISIALMEDKQLVEYQNEPREASFSVGNIYIAKVKKLMPGLNACFVDVGYERDAFLHYLDLGSHFNSYQKYLKQVQSDRKKLFPFSKASILLMAIVFFHLLCAKIVACRCNLNVHIFFYVLLSFDDRYPNISADKALC